MRTIPLSGIQKLLAASVAAASIAATALPAAANQTVAYTSSPVKLVHYTVDNAGVETIPYLGTFLGVAKPGQITISFVDTGSQPATDVVFSVRTGNATETIVDKGHFSPGVSITHDFSLGSAGNGASVQIQHVTFADGTSWSSEQ
jgi:hypothetical protein